ncbi:Uncharacterised protein [Vibrio cholerae]|nr:Uncharacterised protein [Vibrio cholerae]
MCVIGHQLLDLRLARRFRHCVLQFAAAWHAAFDTES